MILGLGVDIVEIDRMKAALERRPRLRQRCFSQEECEYADGKSRPEVHYALRFAAKEAVLKALGTGFAGMRFTDVAVVRDERGRPTPRLSGRAAEVAEALGVCEMHLSLSFTHATAVASAVAIGAVPIVDASDEASARERFSATFKEMRGVLDDIDERPDDPTGPPLEEPAAG